MGKSPKTKETTSGTQQVTLPAWMSQAGEQLYGDAAKTAKDNPVQAYGGQMTAGAQPNQTAAAGVATGQNTAGRGDLGMARWMTGTGATGGVNQMTGGTFDNAAAEQYRNPYVEQVQNRTMQEMTRQNTMARNDLGDNVAAGGAYGGTRQAVLEAEQAKGQNNNMLDYLARSNADAYGAAGDAFERDRSARMQAEGTNIGSQESGLQRLLQGGGQAAGLGAQDQQMGSSAIMDLLRTGGTLQDSDNSAKGAAYQEFLRMQDAPLERYRDLGAILAGTPRNMTTKTDGKSTSTTSAGWLNTALGIGQMAASAFSDRRLKRDIERVGTLPSGLGIYSYRYMWDAARRYVGVMADEVERLMPEALGPVVFGFKTVNYGRLV